MLYRDYLDGTSYWRRQGEGIYLARNVTIGMLRQQIFENTAHTVQEEMMVLCPSRDTWDRERFEFEQEYDRIFTGFGFAKEDKEKLLSDFSGGEQTKIAMVRLLLEKPDILLLDEPTNHLDMESVRWLENYLQNYSGAVVMVSHDRYFIDETAEIVYELTDKKHLTGARKYSQNYFGRMALSHDRYFIDETAVKLNMTTDMRAIYSADSRSRRNLAIWKAVFSSSRY